jgi:hypothetical protein
MKSLTRKVLNKSKEYIRQNCSDLTQQLYIHWLEEKNYHGVITALASYQNADGGFGHNLEGDFALPASSVLATSVGFQILSEINASSSEPLVQKSIAYLRDTYLSEKMGWITVPKEVNDYPHASWWHHNADQGGSVIDLTWGNPTAELVGYLLEYQELVPADWVSLLYAHTLNYFKNHPESMEMHELYCFLRLAERMPDVDFLAQRGKLITLVKNAVATDPEAWKGYVAQPLNFVIHPDSFLYPYLSEHVEVNLDFWVDNLQEVGLAYPAWSWDGYEEAWRAARKESIGRITVSNLRILKNFGRIET